MCTGVETKRQLRVARYWRSVRTGAVRISLRDSK